MQNYFQPWRRHMLMWGVAALCIATSTVAATPQQYQLYLVRHAEKQQVSSTESDPVLSECGLAQAKALATLLQQVQLPRLYHSPYQRSRQTASALLQTNRQLQQYQATATAALAQQLLQQQQSALVVGHSNTIPALVSLLTAREVPAMHEQQYGLIYQLSFSGQQLLTVQLLQLPAPAACQSAAHERRAVNVRFSAATGITLRHGWYAGKNQITAL